LRIPCRNDELPAELGQIGSPSRSAATQQVALLQVRLCPVLERRLGNRPRITACHLVQPGPSPRTVGVMKIVPTSPRPCTWAVLGTTDGL
jgi:hypothetical protein